MVYLTGVLRSGMPPEVGYMLTPDIGQRPPAGAVWAADSGCFSQGERFSEARWLAWLGRLHNPRCLFATAPDVVGDAEATWRRSEPHLETIRSLGYRAALVAQEGFDAGELDWSQFDCLFIGGLTVQWKFGLAVRVAIREAKARGMWVHMGRVNSLRRLRASALMGCDSADGTFLRFRLRQKGPGVAVALAEMATWIRRLEAEPFLPLEA